MIIVHKIGKSELALNVDQPSYDENIQQDACRVQSQNGTGNKRYQAKMEAFDELI